MSSYKSKQEKLSSEEFTIITKGKLKAFKHVVTISKKIAQKAVDRNRIKRLILECLRQRNDLDNRFQIIVKKNISGLKMPEVKEKIEKLIKKL